MRLASVDDGSLDGRLAVVAAEADRLLLAEPATTLQRALDTWSVAEPQLRQQSEQLQRNPQLGRPIDLEALLAPLPRAYEWLDGSSYLRHVRLARQARGAPLPPGLEADPLMYQGGGGSLLAPRADFTFAAGKEGAQLDFEAELCVAVTGAPLGCTHADCADRVALLLLANDWTYRGLVARELAKGFGFIHAKPATGLAPFAVTPDELGPCWRDGRAHIHVRSYVNQELVGNVQAGGEMHFSFFDLIAHAAATRTLTAGTLIGSGTVSSDVPDSGSSCLVERRWQEAAAQGHAKTPFLQAGDRVTLEGWLGERNLFGTLSQAVAKAPAY